MKIGRDILLTVFCLIISVIIFRNEISDLGAQNVGDAMLSMDDSAGGAVSGTDSGFAGFLGETERGPAAPQVLTGLADYESIFGGYTGRSYMPYAVKGFFDNGGKKLYVARIISNTAESARMKLKNGKKDALTINALNGGEWGNRIALRVTEGKNTTEASPTFRLEIFWFSYKNYTSVKSGKPAPSQADIAEVFDDVAIQDDSPYFFQNSVNSRSNLIKISLEEEDAGLLPDQSDKIYWCAGGSDGDAPVLSDFMDGVGLDGNSAAGLNAFGKVDDISTLYSPLSFMTDGLDKALIAQCEALQDRTVIFDTAFGDFRPDPWSTHESSFAACYTPWVQVTGFDSKDVMIPPGGYIAGIYAENDPAKGLKKAPGYDVITGVNEVERDLSEQEQEALTIRKINPIISISDTEYAVYGAYTLSDMLHQYKNINLRRYVNYLFDTFSNKLDWIAGQEWSNELQKQIKIGIENFLDVEWRKGVLAGSSQIEAYYVKVEQQNVAQSGSQKSTIVMEVGVALLEPSEYFVFKIIKYK